MQYMNQPSDPARRVAQARALAATASQLDWTTRVLLAAAEAADATVAPAVRAQVACAIADKAGDAFGDLATVRAAHHAVVDALASAGVADHVPGPAVTRLVWRLVFDLWGGPDR
jgi:hypothetical protein